MKAETLASILALWSLAACLIPAAAGANGLSLSTRHGTVDTEVTIPAMCGYGEGSYQLYWGEANQLLGQGEMEEGCISMSFIVPEAARGEHKVTLRVAGDSFSTEFTVLPSISLSNDDGTVGSELTVTGKGFGSNESDIAITYDGSPAETAIAADTKGSWQETLEVPASSRGEHIIDAGGTTPAEDVEDRTFAVTPRIDISPTSGWVSTVVSIAGTGFDSGETNITVTYDGLAVKTGGAADNTGSWESSFWIPTSAKGSHKVTAYGADTSEADVTGATFTVSPGIKLELASGYLGGTIHAGHKLWVSGIGFEANEPGVRVTLDGNLVISGITADAKGSWSGQLEVPPTTSGEHVIDASGDTTDSADVADATIVISPEMEISPTSGAIGDDIVVTGTGFAGSEAITISYDGSQVSSGTTTDARGGFTASFEIPKSQAGDHTITVSDPAASVASASLTVESTPPPTPRPLSPEAGTTIGFVGKSTVALAWSDVEDPSGVHYLMEISRDADFSGARIRKEGLTQSEYTLPEDEALSKGEYYWRVKAIDGAGNEGDWTNGQLFQVGVIEWWQLLVSIIAAIGILAIVWRVTSISIRGGWK